MDRISQGWALRQGDVHKALFVEDGCRGRGVKSVTFPVSRSTRLCEDVHKLERAKLRWSILSGVESHRWPEDFFMAEMPGGMAGREISIQ